MNEKKNIIIIGSSAGGPRILKEIFNDLPKLNGSILLIQHMPGFINQSICDSLNEISHMQVKIAEDKEILKPGNVYVAPSEYHLKLFENERIYLEDSQKINYVCPSIDVTMTSLVPSPNYNILGIILTGMGRDGAQGINYIKQIGGTTIAQDEKTCIIFGMPKEAIATGSVDLILNPAEIKKTIIQTTGVTT